MKVTVPEAGEEAVCGKGKGTAALHSKVYGTMGWPSSVRV